jgi:hypothetical protein
MMIRPHHILVVALTTLAVCAAGCLQIETRIRLHEDGSATVTERLRFSRRLLDLAAKGEAKGGVAELLTKEAALRRIEQMGEHVKLVRHETRDAEKGARESVTVFTVPDLRDFRYVSPYLAAYNYPKHNVLTCNLFPIYESTWYGRRAGQMAVTFKPASQGKPPRRPKDWTPPPGPSPRDLQVFRDLQPVFRDLMSDFQLRLVFESYAPIRFKQYYRYRGARAGTREYDLIDFSDKDLDKHGYEFLANEEIMLELLRLKTGGADIVNHVKEHGTNLTLPVYHPRGIPEIYFNPSRPFFDKYFKRKKLHFDKRRGGTQPATWKRIGWKGNAGSKKKP